MIRKVQANTVGEKETQHLIFSCDWCLRNLKREEFKLGEAKDIKGSEGG